MDSARSDQGRSRGQNNSTIIISKGELLLVPEQRTASFLRVRVDDTPAWDVICERVWETLQHEFKLKLPGLLISVIGDCDNQERQPKLEGIVQEGLLSAAKNTDAWIITDATDAKLTAMVGEAVQDYKCTLKDNRSSQHDTPLLLGITSASSIAQRHEIKKATKVKDPVEFKKDIYEKLPHLERNHTHFLLMKDLEDYEHGATAIEFRSEFEKYISAKTIENTTQQGVSGNAMPLSPPKVLFLVGGGMTDLEAVQTALNEDCPVIAIATSGGAADLLAKTRYFQKKKKMKKTRQIGTKRGTSDLMKEFAKIFGDHANQKKAKKIARACCEAGMLGDLLNIFNPSEKDLSKVITYTVLSAVLQREKRAAEDNTSEESTNKALNSVLFLAIKWHCCDYVKEKLNKGAWEPKLFLFDALLEDQNYVVKYFLEQGEKLEEILNKKHLEELYNSKKNTYMHDLLCYSAHFFKKHRKEQFSLAYINKVLVHLMRDDSFSFDSAFKKERLGHTRKSTTDTDGHQPKLENTKLHERDLFLWAILVNRREMSLLFWRHGLDHLGGALCASALLKRLSMIAERRDLAEMSEDLAKHSEEWEQLAVKVLTKCYSLNVDLTHRLLVRKLTRWGPPKSSGTSSAALRESEPGCTLPENCDFGRPKGEPSVLLMAETYKMMKFVEQPACQTKLSIIWKGFMACDTNEFWIFLCMLLPIFLPRLHFRVIKNNNVEARDSNQDGSNNQKKQFLRRSVCDLLHFYNAPITKFFTNIVANLVYLAIFSFFLLVELGEGPPTVLEYITWAWLFTMMMEEIRQMLFKCTRSLRYKLLNWLSFPWNQFDVTLYIIFIITVTLRFASPIYGANFKWTRWFYSITLVMCFIRFTQYFYGVKSIGPKVIMIQKMVKDMVLFLAVLLVFVIGFGIAYQANIFPNSSPDWNIVVNIFYFPYFQIFGELFLDSLRGEGEAECTRNETVWRQDPTKRCPEDGGYIVLLMLGVYMIVTNILLVNLLIAMFSHTFQEVQKKSMEVWSYYRLSLVHEYFSRPATVPPFIVIHYIYRSIRAICCDRSEGCCKEYHAFRRDYKEDERQLTLFERTAVKTIFFEVKTKEPTTIKDVVDIPDASSQS